MEQESTKNISSKAVQTEDVEQVIKSFKCKKAPGPDNLAPEHIKYGGGYGPFFSPSYQMP